MYSLDPISWPKELNEEKHALIGLYFDEAKGESLSLICDSQVIVVKIYVIWCERGMLLSSLKVNVDMSNQMCVDLMSGFLIFKDFNKFECCN